MKLKSISLIYKAKRLTLFGQNQNKNDHCVYCKLSSVNKQGKYWSKLRASTRALPDITSGPEVRQIFKIQTVRKPDVFLPGRRTFKIEKHKQFFFFKKNFNFFFISLLCFV